MSKITELSRRYLDFRMARDPVEATFQGVHDYDDRLADPSPEARADDLARIKSFARELDAVEGEGLSPPETFARGVLENFISTDLITEEELRLAERAPFVYLEQVNYGLFILVTREFAPAEKRLTSALRRADALPAYLEAAKRSLTPGCPRTYLDITRTLLPGARQFFAGTLPGQFASSPVLRKDYEVTGRKAVAALDDFSAFVEDRLAAGASEEFACGREIFDRMLRQVHLLPYDARDLKAIGEEELARAKERLAEVARRIDPHKSWRDIHEDMKADHPGAADLLDAYRREMTRARDFVQEHDLATIPEGEDLEVTETPSFTRAVIPFAAYINPAPFEMEQKGLFFVTPPEPDLPPEKIEEVLQGHSVHKIPETALHEGYPGHHLQLVRANQAENDLAKTGLSHLFAEGWALYCEEMMGDHGFYTDPRQHLAQLLALLWRAVRVIVDVGLHTENKSFDWAVGMLVGETGMPRPHAEAEVRRYAYTPTQPMSYLIGKLEILKLLERWRSANPDSPLKEFHDQLIAHGTVPPTLIARRMGIADSPPPPPRR